LTTLYPARNDEERPMKTAVQAEERRKEFRADVPFTKSSTNEDGDLELVGYASTWVQDRDGDYVDPKAFDAHLGPYLAKNPILLYQHDMRKPLGSVDSATVDANGLFVRCTVPKPDPSEEDWKHTAYHSAKRGTLRTFSIGGFFSFDVENIGEDDEKWIIREVELLEISVVSIPSNPDSIFEAAVKAAKGLGARSAKRMHEKAFAQMLQLLGIEELTDPDLCAMDEQQQADRFAGLGRLYEEVSGRTAPDYEAYRDIVAPLEEDADLIEKMRVLAAVSDLVSELYAPPTEMEGAKAGRVLSKSNEDKLRAAKTLLDEILVQVDEQPSADEQHEEVAA
jgi:HK97 family phage prohead protease